MYIHIYFYPINNFMQLLIFVKKIPIYTIIIITYYTICNLVSKTIVRLFIK